MKGNEHCPYCQGTGVAHQENGPDDFEEVRCVCTLDEDDNEIDQLGVDQAVYDDQVLRSMLDYQIKTMEHVERSIKK